MADWREGLLPASWRGLPCYYKDTGNNAGRRLAVFEFPGRDTPYVQDLGRSAKHLTLLLYVCGDDYMAQREAFEAACDAPGAGTLVHPYKGPMQVYCARADLKELSTAGRMASFECEFVETGGLAAPLATADTSAQAQSAAATVNSQLASDFSGGGTSQ